MTDEILKGEPENCSIHGSTVEPRRGDDFSFIGVCLCDSFYGAPQKKQRGSPEDPWTCRE